MFDLKNWIKKHEGLHSHSYLDETGNLIIGWGHNINEKGLRIDEANLIFDNDFEQCIDELSYFKWYKDQPDNVKGALIDMCFNLGIGRLLGFRKMISALMRNDYTQAAIECLDSKWAEQVGERAKDVALMLRQG
jgi:lysozyme